MHAISAYPTKFENINLNIISEYKKLSEKNKKLYQVILHMMWVI